MNIARDYWAVSTGAILRCVRGETAMDAAMNAILLQMKEDNEVGSPLEDEELGEFLLAIPFGGQYGDTCYFKTQSVLDEMGNKGWITRVRPTAKAGS